MDGWTDEADAALAGWVARADPPPPPRGGTAALGARVVARAEPLLAARRAGRRRRARVGYGMGLALAAGVGALVLRPPASDPAAADPRLEAAVTAPISEAEFRALAAGAAESRAFLLRALEER